MERLGKPAKRIGLWLVALIFVAAANAPAHAEFRVCNETRHTVRVALGQSNGNDWISQGWWDVGTKKCQVVIAGVLNARYYYLYAVQFDIGGGWTGDRYFCTARRSFTITGRDDCDKRGYDRTGFFEVDTQEALDYTHILTDPAE